MTGPRSVSKAAKETEKDEGSAHAARKAFLGMDSGETRNPGQFDGRRIASAATAKATSSGGTLNMARETMALE